MAQNVGLRGREPRHTVVTNTPVEGDSGALGSSQLRWPYMQERPRIVREGTYESPIEQRRHVEEFIGGQSEFDGEPRAGGL